MPTVGFQWLVHLLKKGSMSPKEAFDGAWEVHVHHIANPLGSNAMSRGAQIFDFSRFCNQLGIVTTVQVVWADFIFTSKVDLLPTQVSLWPKNSNLPDSTSRTQV